MPCRSQEAGLHQEHVSAGGGNLKYLGPNLLPPRRISRKQDWKRSWNLMPIRDADVSRNGLIHCVTLPLHKDGTVHILAHLFLSCSYLKSHLPKLAHPSFCCCTLWSSWGKTYNVTPSAQLCPVTGLKEMLLFPFSDCIYWVLLSWHPSGLYYIYEVVCLPRYAASSLKEDAMSNSLAFPQGWKSVKYIA